MSCRSAYTAIALVATFALVGCGDDPKERRYKAKETAWSECNKANRKITSLGGHVGLADADVEEDAANNKRYIVRMPIYDRGPTSPGVQNKIGTCVATVENGKVVSVE